MVAILKKIARVAKYYLYIFVSIVHAGVLKVQRGDTSVWIISERGVDARDNSYHFFKWIRNSHPEIDIYYVIDRNSADYEKVTQIGKTIQYNSYQHFLIFAIADVRISTHAWGGDIPYADYYRKSGFWRNSTKKFVFLQHGITKDYIPSLCFPNIKPNIFICGAKPEYDYIQKNYLYQNNEVKYTGFARYDNLYDTKMEDMILIMPTFRKWLVNDTGEEFINSNYYMRWQEIINSSELLGILKRNKLKLIFYPHFSVQKFAHLFESQSDSVVIAGFDNYDVQDLLIRAKLLITDFSSVFFDFAYMEKPVIYYQFDRNKYISEHYDFTKGYFSYDDLGFGEVAFTVEDLMKYINRYIESGFKMNPAYLSRRDMFFEKHDRSNCERIYQCILELQK